MNGVKVLQAEPEDESTERTLNRLDCYEHPYGDWRTDIDRDDQGRKTMSRVCRECGYTQVRR